MQKNIVITIGDHPNKSLELIAEELEREGVNIENSFEFGVITGKIEETLIPKLYKNREVVTVTIEKKIQLPPKDSDIQ